MIKKHIFIKYYIVSKIRGMYLRHYSAQSYLVQKKGRIYGKTMLSVKEFNSEVAKKINTGVPFMIGRLGATELSVMKTFDFSIEKNYSKMMAQFKNWSGFFPQEVALANKFVHLMKKSILNVDYIGLLLQPFEDYYLKKYANGDVKTTYIDYLEPWLCIDNPWSSALKGKKVLVIHPFTETIEQQYCHQKELFRGTEILPEFQLKTLRAVQTVGKEQDDRFKDWFEALLWMYNEALKFDFDIAIIGCGAYGFPLAAMLKEQGKQAIHLGGATQILFGIKGSRWDLEEYGYVRRYYNEYWTKPLPVDTPQSARLVEGNSYW